ncbi:MAG: APC family permease [Sphingomonas sp.]|nr:APC family permease [Sphingomonas sp.]
MALTTTAPGNGKLRRSVGFWGLAAMVLNGMIAAGIFALPAAVADNSGAWAPLIVMLVGLAMLPIVLVHSRLAALFDGTGGPILYVEHAFGKAAAFQIGWMQLLSTTAGAAANSNLLADYVLRWFASGPTSPAVHAAAVLGGLLLIFAINLCATGAVARTLGLMSVLKLAPLLLLIVVTIPTLATRGLAPHPATAWSLPQAVLLSAYAFTGFEGALTLAGEAQNPRRDLPLALMAVFVVISLLYAVLTWGYVATAYAPGVADAAPLSTMAMLLLGSVGAMVMLAGVTFSITGNLTNAILLIPRRLVALEALGGLPRWFGRIRVSDGVPANAVWFVMAMVIALALSGGFTTLAALSVASRLIVYLGSIAALPVIDRRRTIPTTWRGVALILAAAATSIVLVAGSKLESWLSLAVTASIGALVFGITRKLRGAGSLSATQASDLPNPAEVY